MMAQPRQVTVSDILPRQRENWMENEVLRVLQHIWSKDGPPTGQDLAWAFQAAKKDGGRQETQKQYPYALASYQFAWSIANMCPAIVTAEDLREVLIGVAKLSLRMRDIRTAMAAANECIYRNPTFSKAYKVMSDVGLLLVDPSLAAHALLDGMVKCSLQPDELVDFIATACEQIVCINTLAGSGNTHALKLPEIQPKLPDAPETWNKVLQRLYDNRQFAALALVTSGLTDKHMTTCLDCAAKSVAVVCHRMDVENVLDRLTKQQARDWGSELSIFIIDHGGKIGKKSKDPLALHLVQLAVKTECPKVMGHVLQKKNWQGKVDVNQSDPTGKTALHVAARSASGLLREELVTLLLENGACSYIRDEEGKMPQDHVTRGSPIYNKLSQPHTFESIKARGNDAFKKKKFTEAVTAYKEAVAQLSREKCRSRHRRERAVLNCNMAASYLAMNKTAEAKEHAEGSIKEDSTYFKAYFRLGKILLLEHKLRDACDEFCTGLFCPSTRAAEKVDFLVEIALLLPQLRDNDSILKRVKTPLKESWSKVLDALCVKNAWDAICCLLLGPPYCSVQDRTADGWKFSDQYKTDGRNRVGYAMNFELRPTVSLSLSDITEKVKGYSGASLRDLAADLVLALLLQGAELQKESSESRYHAALRLCCVTGKLGLMRYMLSDEPRLKEALGAVDEEGKTLLHLACELGEKSSRIREQTIQLLLEKGFDPATKDNAGNQADLGPQRPSAKFFKADSSKTDASPRPTHQHHQAASGVDSQPNREQRGSPKSSSCHSCSKLMGAAKKSFKANPDVSVAFGKLVQVLTCKHSPRNERHQELDQGAMDLLVAKLTTICLEKGIPNIILKLPEHRLQQTVQMMAEYRKWEALKVFLGKLESGKSLASKVTVKTHIFSSTESTFPEKEVFRLLLDQGAKLPPDDHPSVVQAALDKGQIDLLEVLLFEQKLDPKLLSAKKDCKDCRKSSKDCQDGEKSQLCENCEKLSPAHAAFEIALKGIGNFTLFDNLRVRYDAQGKDENGNTFLHLALKAVDSNHSREAVQHLVQLKLVHNDWNLAKDMAVDYLKKSSDRRADILMDHFISDMATIGEEDLDRAKARRDKWLEGNKVKSKTKSDRGRQGAEKEEKTEEGVSNSQPAHSAIELKHKAEKEDDTKFEGLLWEVVLTEDVHRKLNSKKVPPHTRKKIINIIKQLASGETRRKLVRELENAEPIRLYEANITRGERLIYEIAPDFSPSQKVYIDVIRVWDIVLDHKKIFESVSRIKASHKRGEGCQSQVKLKVLPDAPGGAKSLVRPRRYAKVDEDQESDTTVYPPASADETEYQILKFFTLTSNMELSWLEKVDVKTDFLFRVTEREYDIIELSTGAPILLLGRSGTGKTTCCLYRLMIYFLKYWTEAMTNDYQPQLTFREYESEEDHDEARRGKSESGEERESTSELDSEDMLGGEHSESVGGACGGVQDESASSQPASPHTSPTREEKQTERSKTADASGSKMTLVTEKVHLHQVFVTKNPVLCEAVQKNFRELCHAEPVAKHHTAIEERPLPHRLQDMDEYQYPLFLTLWKLILMLDSSLPGPHFFKRNKDGSLCVLLPKESSAIDDLHGYQSGEESESEEDEEAKETSTPRSSGRQHPLKADPRRRVTYELFAEEIWPRMLKGVKADYHPSLVWMEIMSFIKGSLQALTSPNGFLDFESYDKVGRKQAPNFVGDRKKIYALFENYKNYIQRRDMYDEADLLFHIFKRLRTVSLQQSQHTDPESERLLPEWVIHEIYVDETQDFTQAELFLLMCLTDQPNRMFLTGDTAQSIMRGVAFRFTDLKTLFYHAREMRVLAEHTQLQVPKHVYQLTQNYRSHDGILRMASGILDLLYEFFPESFDRLARDRGLFGGPKPALIESASPADLVTFLAGNQRQTSHIEFGAHQVVLVVNDEARKDLPEEMSKALRLTIYEAKGLEFDDVLLYNFFKDSQASKKEWQVVLSCIDKLCKAATEGQDEQKSASASGLFRIHEDALKRRGAEARNFDEKKHKILNSELKHLYTAVTRARANVYIFDEDEEKRNPMFHYFQSREVAEVKNNLYSAGGTARGSFAKKSSPREWVKRGDELMRLQLYSRAADCYSNADNDFLRNIAVAHARMNTASVMQRPSRPLEDAPKTAYLKAAILFLECQRESQQQKQPPEQWYYLATEGAGRCLEKGGKHFRAARVYEKNRKLREAAGQYEKAEKWESASKCHEEMLDYHRALTCLARGSLYDLALKCLQRFHDKVKEYQNSKKLPPKALIKPGTEFTDQNLRLKKAKALKEGGKNDEMLQALEGLEPEEQINFLVKNNCFELAAEKMAQKGARSDAVWMLLHNGMIDKAIEHAGESEDVALKAQCYLHKARILIYSDGRSDKDRSRSGQDRPEDSVPDTWDKNLRDAERLLGEAVTLFKQQSMQNEAGECLLLMAQLNRDKRRVSEALKFYQKAPNSAGILECYQELYHAEASGENGQQDISRQQLLEGVDYTSELVCSLFDEQQHSNPQFRQCLHFFGFDISDASSLIFYPCLRPRWLSITTKTWKSNTETLTGKEMKHALRKLATFLAERAMTWYRVVLDAIKKDLKQAAKSQELLSRDQLQENTRRLLRLYGESVWLDHSAAGIAKCLPETHDVFTKRFASVESLLQFILPPGLPRYHTNSVYKFCCQIQERKSRMHRRIFEQIEQYVLHLRAPESPGQNQDKSERPGEETSLQKHCRTTKFIVRVSLISTIFGHQGLADAFCSDLELQLSEIPEADAKGWMRKTTQYAVWTDKKLEIRMHLARRYLDAVSYLLGLNTKHSSEPFNPNEALIKFTQFIKLIGDRKQIDQMPDNRLSLFWIEIFTTIALFLVDKCKGGRTFSALPACYFRSLHMLNLVEPFGNEMLQQWLQNYNSGKFNLKLVLERMQYLTRFLCGSRPEDFSLLGHLSTQARRSEDPSHFLQLERALIVGLVLLLNSRLAEVSGEQQVPILRVVNKLCENTQGMPVRLKALVESVRDAKDYSHIFKAVATALASIGDSLRFYRWHWKERGLMPQVEGKAAIPEGPLPSLETVKEKEKAAELGPEASESKPDGTQQAAQTTETEGDTLGDTREEEKEEVEKEEEDVVSAEDEAKLKERLEQTRLASGREGVEKMKEKQVSRDRDLDIMIFFPQDPLTETNCAICGQNYEQVSNDEEQETDFPEDDEVAQDVLTAKSLTPRQLHEKSREHQKKEMEYKTFYEVCETQIARCLCEIGGFFSKIQIDKHAELYSDHPHELHSYDKYKSVRQAVQKAVAYQDWKNTETLCKTVDELKSMFSERKVETTFFNIFTNFQRSQETGAEQEEPLTLRNAADFLRHEGESMSAGFEQQVTTTEAKPL